MESLLVHNVDAAVQFLCSTIPGCYIERAPSPSPRRSGGELAASNGVYAVLRIENTNAAMDSQGRRVMVHDLGASRFLRSMRLCVSIVDIGLFIESASHYPGVQLVRPLEGGGGDELITDVFDNVPLGCFAIGPGGVEIICVKAGDGVEEEIDPCVSLLDIEAASSWCPDAPAIPIAPISISNINSNNSTNVRSQSQESSSAGLSGGLLPGGADPNPRGTRFPRLFPFLLDGPTMRPIDCNTSAAVPFKTDIFEGCAMLVVNASTDPSIVVDTTKLTFEVQVQGKFLRKPRGMMFIGAEISKKMELGMITRSLCRSIMQFARSKLPSLHHSFGDDNNVEWPHITGPLWSMSDLMVVTKPGETPPPLGRGALPESAESRRMRRKDPDFTIDVNLDCTYSFSTNTCNLDIVNWEVCNIPLLSTLDLHTFWTNADLMLCAYELVPALSGARNSDVHERSRINYCFRLLLKHGTNHPELTHPTIQTAPQQQQQQQQRQNTLSVVSPSLRSLIHQGGEDGADLFMDEQDEFFDAFTDEDQLSSAGRPDEFYSTVERPPPATMAAVLSGRLTSVVLSADSFVFVPVVFEVDDDRKLSITNAGARRVYYGVKFPGVFSAPGRSGSRPARLDTNLSLKSYKECTKALSHIRWNFKKPINYSRLDEIEQRRSELQSLFTYIFETEISKIASSTTNRALFKLFSDTEATEGLLDDSKGMDFGVADRKRREDIVDIQFGSRVLLQLGRFYWSETYLVMSGTELVFIMPSSKLGKSARIQVHLDDVIDVCLVHESQHPMLGISKSFFFFRVSTFAKQYNVMVRGEENRDEWISRLTQRCSLGPRALESNIASLESIEIGNNSSGSYSLTSLAMLSEPRGFTLGQCVVLNGRRIQANPSIVHMDRLAAEPSGLPRDSARVLPSDVASSSPKDVVLPPVTDDRFVVSVDFASKIVAIALNLILNIAAMTGSTPEDSKLSPSERIDLLKLWIEFMDAVAVLANIKLDMTSFDPKGKIEISMFLNLYHTMVLHAFLVVRVPTSMQEWPNVFSGCAYEAFGDIFSISDLEHGVLRGGMSKPQILVASLLISKPLFEFTLTCRDLRLIWAMNCGSMSMLDSIPIYTASRLGQQLDRNMSLSMERQCVILTNSVRLSVLCQWFRKDITAEDTREGIQGVLTALMPYMSPAQATTAAELIRANRSRITVMYTPLMFRCRLLKLQS